MKTKKILSLFVMMLMMFNMVQADMFANEPEGITVNVTIVQGGQFAATVNGTEIAHIPVTVTDANGSGNYDIDDVLYGVHTQYYDGVAENGYASAETEYGLSLLKLWGDDSGVFGYYKNNVSVMSLADIVTEDDNICAFVYQDKINWSDQYTYFEDSTMHSIKGQPLSVKLKKLEFNENWETVSQTVENAVITIDGNITEYKTNAQGIAEITFDTTGKHTLSAVTDYAIVPPVSIITVAEDVEEDALPPAGNEEIPEPSVPDAEDKDYNRIIPEVLGKIATTYIDASSDWIVMDMGAYADYIPEAQNKLTEEAKQQYINSAIKTIKDTTSDKDIVKAVLGLAAIEKNPELLYPAGSDTSISAIQKLNSITKSTSAWVAPYTLAVYNQGDYDTDGYETEIINALLAKQEGNGCFNEYGTIDTTANIIAGLSFYIDRPEVAAAIENAVNYLSTQQNADGTFSDGYSGANSNSTAMVAIGLCAAGVDLINDTRFIKNDKSILDGLMSFLVTDGNGFGYTNNEAINAMATEQSFRALISIMQTIKTDEAYNIYDFSDNEFTPAQSTEIITSPIWSGSGGGISSSASAEKTEKPGDPQETEDESIEETEEITPVQSASSIFNDAANHWASDAIDYVYSKSIMKGISTTDFAPDNTMTRAMLVTVLYRLENQKVVKGKHSFSDIPADEWYTDAVLWAAEEGIVNGVSTDKFEPDTSITREQMATILYRYVQYKGQSISADGYKKLSYTDAGEISDYAVSAIMWASSTGIMNGESEYVINPKGASTRAQVATVLMRYLEM